MSEVGDIYSERIQYYHTVTSSSLMRKR